MAINYTPVRNIYPTLGAETLGQMVTGPMPGPNPERVASGAASEELERALMVGGQANPLVGLLVFGGLALGIMLLAQRLGGPDGFGNIRASAYNILLVSLLAVAGIPVWKFVFTRVKVPGISTWVHSV